ncbi:MAG TPA: indole-3-glycerol phosphate synthase TrpC [Vicinamibacterales bacterium]|jgi:indole-3-glycerol phosphate synthase|nr:indole-3-glycerol phosphate synthase TrpC [Vicinamibacterales bacterium]
MTTMADVLEAIVAAARRSATERERGTSRASLERVLADRRPNGAEFRASLGKPGIRVIAECKRRSPSRGILRSSYDPASIARGYNAAGAAAISVLTEPSFFDGSLDHLRAVRAAVDVPLLRKDFVVTDYQVIEAAAAGADAVLLIVAALEPDELMRLAALARSIGLAALVEVHDREELTCALDVGADLVGVNSRNLRTLAVDQSVLDAVGAEIPKGVTAVAESGLKTPDDLRRLHALRYDAFLIGERFMIEPDPGSALAALREAAAEASV